MKIICVDSIVAKLQRIQRALSKKTSRRLSQTFLYDKEIWTYNNIAKLRDSENLSF